jgi:plasmid stabilization system protein ParE
MAYELTRRAQQAEQTIISKRNAEAGFAAASKLRAALANAYELLGEYPDLGEYRPEFTERPYKFFPCDVFWIVFEPKPDRRLARIVTIVDARRDLPTVLHREC